MDEFKNEFLDLEWIYDTNEEKEYKYLDDLSSYGISLEDEMIIYSYLYHYS